MTAQENVSPITNVTLDLRKKMLAWACRRTVSQQECTIDTPPDYSAWQTPQVRARGSRLLASLLENLEFPAQPPLGSPPRRRAPSSGLSLERENRFPDLLRLGDGGLQTKPTTDRFAGEMRTVLFVRLMVTYTELRRAEGDVTRSG